jgi:hypothetical protein
MYIPVHVKYPLFLSDLDRTGQVFEKSSNIKFNENPSILNSVAPSGHTDMTKLMLPLAMLI